MFNLLVKGSPWVGGSGIFGSDRVISYTDDEVKNKFVLNNVIDFEALMKLPSLFVEETNYQKQQFARIGRVTNVRLQRSDVIVQYSYDSECAPIAQEHLVTLKDHLHIEFPRRGFDEFSTSHWAVKDVDLFRALYNAIGSNLRLPKAFNLPNYQKIDKRSLSVMMPFTGFSAVYEAIQTAAKLTYMECVRGDNVWEHAAIIQDIVTIIDNAAIVICDCTNRNANVFYEIGIAHALGKEVILIVQSKADIPFDLIHLRYIVYLDNSEGLDGLVKDLVARINTLKDR
jgi:hypothetical protein